MFVPFAFFQDFREPLAEFRIYFICRQGQSKGFQQIILYIREQ